LEKEDKKNNWGIGVGGGGEGVNPVSKTMFHSEKLFFNPFLGL
jgi:hypothetical protein